MMLPHFDYSVSLGTITTVLGFIYIVGQIKAKIDLLLEAHTEAIETIRDEMRQHDALDDRRFEEMQTRMIDLVGHVQRLVGQSEVLRRNDRRNT